jgi:hypothetical protein
MHKSFALKPMRHELRDSNESQLVLGSEFLELRPTGRRAVFVEDLAHYARWKKSREPCKIDCRFGMSNALKNSAVACAKWRHVTRPSQVSRNGCGIDGNVNRLRAILRTDSRRHAKARGSIDAHRECSALLFGILFALLRELQLVSALSSEGEADPSARLLDHEVDELRRHQLGSTNQVTFILAVFVIRNDDELACLDVGDRLLDCSEFHL